jgi:site-specific DNA-methyltransferase (adenine-specific)
VALIEQCIKFSGISSGVLVDPFMGSGTSAVAAVKCGLEYIGFDIDTEYRQFAQDRIADFIQQLSVPEIIEPTKKKSKTIQMGNPSLFEFT